LLFVKINAYNFPSNSNITNINNSFDITNEEYARAETYKSLALEMDKNNTLSTLEILGMYAETKAEKRKYARKFSKLFYQYTDRVLGFQKLM
jgi:hypothetical protein